MSMPFDEIVHFFFDFSRDKKKKNRYDNNLLQSTGFGYYVKYTPDPSEIFLISYIYILSPTHQIFVTYGLGFYTPMCEHRSRQSRAIIIDMLSKKIKINSTSLARWNI